MLEKEYEFYQKNRLSLLERYENQYVVIFGEKVIGSYPDKDTAIIEAQKDHKVGTFLVQLCTRDEESQVMRFHSRVAFSANA